MTTQLDSLVILDPIHEPFKQSGLTTLYDVIDTMQTTLGVESGPVEDRLIVATVADWISHGYITFLSSRKGMDS